MKKEKVTLVAPLPPMAPEENVTTEESIDVSYARVVKALCKDGELIIKELNHEKAHMLHMVIGVTVKSSNLLDSIKKYIIYNEQLEVDDIIEKLGDIEFYLEGVRQKLHVDREYILDCNIEKLSRRYTDGEYSDDAANERADKSE